jgi:hypothetical protein
MLSLVPNKIASLVSYKLHTRFISFTSYNNYNTHIPFSKAKEGNFIQDAPHLENSFEGDALLQRNLQRILPIEVSYLNLLNVSLDVRRSIMSGFRLIAMSRMNSQPLVLG